MSRDKKDIDGTLNDFRKQVLRWNGQINLVSRQDTAKRLDGLIQQCRAGWDCLSAPGVSDLATATRLWYFDLGSGAGLPGIVWHVQMAAAGHSVRTILVEPRDKRAWFLERMAHLVGSESLHVLANRWGETGIDDLESPHPGLPPSHVLISLKALHLSDTAVLEGLAPFLEAAKSPRTTAEGDTVILVARFYPPDQKWSEDLAGALDIFPKGQECSARSYVFRSEGGSVLPLATLPGASLVLSRYRIQAR